ncbi:MAG: glycoside hydrolase family 78 protein [Acidobacteria bacterium]|nr:glycoside hydrolase family 78 protein [Acidobacteriota bacterium]
MHPVRKGERGQEQSAYQVLVATSPARLREGVSDSWDSGKVPSQETVHVEYAGKPLQSGRDYWWKVRVWDQHGTASAWSEPSHWGMGLLNAGDWKAKWIRHPDGESAGHNGYRSQFASSADIEKWVAIDLLLDKRLDTVKLFPTKPFDIPDAPAGYLFPVRFRVDVSGNPDFANFQTVIDQTKADYPNPGDKPVELHFSPAQGRYVRLVVTRLASAGQGAYGFALAEMEALQSDPRPPHPLLPLSRAGAVPSASDSEEQGAWSLQFLNDTVTVAQAARAGAPAPALMARKEFQVRAAVARARAYVSALGLYELHVNGKRVGNHVLAPEWTDYNKRVQYQVYDVTDLLQAGENAVGALVGHGWYAGRTSFLPGRRFYGTEPKFLLQLKLEFKDGTSQVIVSDDSWKVTQEGPLRSDDIFDGEVYDARKEMAGWDHSGFNDSKWSAAKVSEDVHAALVSQYDQPIEVVGEVHPVGVHEPMPGVYVADMGQNMVGWVRLQLHAPAGTAIKLRHAEVLREDGSIYTDNLRENLQGAKQTDIYYARGSGEESYEPRFTYHGFRYVEITGLAYKPTPNMLVGKVVHTAAPRTGTLETSNQLVNKLMQNIWWTQVGNLTGIPTDCPQRGERAGWMADAQVFSPAAMFNMDLSRFYSKWFQDIRDAQGGDGVFAAFAPSPFGPPPEGSAVPGWSDAGVLLPWQMYLTYGDTRILESQFDSARRYVDGIHAANPDLIWRKARGIAFTDWLNADTIDLPNWPKQGAATPTDLFATAFFAQSTHVVAEMARVLGRQAEARTYGELAEKIRMAFQKEFVGDDGVIHAKSPSDPALATGAGTSTDGDNQTSYALALNFNLLSPDLNRKAAARMAQNVRSFRNGYLSTGIHGTNRLMLELSNAGYNHLAYQLLTNREVPSWGYMIDHGATTVWERWDGYVEGRGYQAPYMNSFNHYGMGAVGEWIYRNVGGINLDPGNPGFRHFLIRPRPEKQITFAKATYQSVRGEIVSEWRQEAGKLQLRIVVPVNTTATVYVPATSIAQVQEGTGPATQVRGVTFLRQEGGAAVFQVASGEYEFHANAMGPAAETQ